VPSSEPALFRAYPALRHRLPRHPVVSFPTPVEPLALDGVRAGSLFAKRDDHCCPLYGGNKPRKLEFVIGTAVARGAGRLVTTGALGSNHGLATTIVGRDAGLATTLVLLRQPITPDVRRALLLDAAYGADLVYGANVAGTAAQVLRVLAASALRGERPFLVATGGSSIRGMVGFVSAALEVAEQVRAGTIPAPAQVYVAVGTGGTLAGLVAGFKLARLGVRVVGVLVTDILPPSRRSLAGRARAVLRWLRRAEPRIPEVDVSPADFDLVRDQLGAGYGAPTPAARDAVDAAAAGGLELETTYTGKCLAAIRERAARGELPEAPVLFWNTYNGVDVAALAPRPLDPAALPAGFRQFLRLPDAD
jgi:D-cysteine desulfhydrase